MDTVGQVMQVVILGMRRSTSNHMLHLGHIFIVVPRTQLAVIRRLKRDKKTTQQQFGHRIHTLQSNNKFAQRLQECYNSPLHDINDELVFSTTRTTTAYKPSPRVLGSVPIYLQCKDGNFVDRYIAVLTKKVVKIIRICLMV